MRLSTHSNHDWLSTASRLALDMTIWVAAFFIGTGIRFWGNSGRFWESLVNYMPGLVLSALCLGAAAYASGLYSIRSLRIPLHRRLLLVTCCLAVAAGVLLALGSIKFSWQIGRGVLLLSILPAALTVWVHHFILHHRSRRFLERSAFIISGNDDEVNALLLDSLQNSTVNFLGCFTRRQHPLTSNLTNLGDFENIVTVVEKLQIKQVFCSSESLHDSETARLLRRLRYSGVAINSVSRAFEEVYQAVPLDLIDDEWLLYACSQPAHIYISKLKRLGDVALALSVGLPLLPFLLLGIILVKFSSPGPIFYTQERLGRFGRKFHVIKLRSMGTDAEAGGAQWSTKNDPRVTPSGRFLRKFRLDEIPQLWNVLVGDMSFVGPRPERDEFTEELSKQIPYFHERHLIRPGLTGWAQVCYPYGASIEDARRKLEFDLYYLKHMGLLLDVFVILDTIKIVLTGGASESRGENLKQFEVLLAEAQKKTHVTANDSLSV